MPKFFNLSFSELLEAKHPDMWILFERGDVDEKAVMENFFLDKRDFDHAAFIAMMVSF